MYSSEETARVHCTFLSQKRCGLSFIRVPFSPSGTVFMRDEHDLCSVIQDRDKDTSSSDSRVSCFALLAFPRSSNCCFYAYKGMSGIQPQGNVPLCRPSLVCSIIFPVTLRCTGLCRHFS